MTGAKKVLLLEDDELLREILRDHLSDYEFIEFDNGLKCADFDPSNIDLAIMDVQVPGLSGPEVAKILRRKNPNLNFLFLTGGTPVDLQEVWQGGPASNGVCVIEKPFQFEQLDNCLANIGNSCDNL
jgi:DNA-binding response OmpR family regulator